MRVVSSVNVARRNYVRSSPQRRISLAVLDLGKKAIPPTSDSSRAGFITLIGAGAKEAWERGFSWYRMDMDLVGGHWQFPGMDPPGGGRVVGAPHACSFPPDRIGAGRAFWADSMPGELC